MWLIFLILFSTNVLAQNNIYHVVDTSDDTKTLTKKPIKKVVNQKNKTLATILNGTDNESTQ